jgi:transposase
MVTLGTDSHKRTHTVVAVDSLGQQLGVTTVNATTDGHLELLHWVVRWPERRWALEDCRNLSRRLESDLLRAGEVVVRVSPKLMTGARKAARTVGKSDPIDALAVARAALREGDLPTAFLDPQTRELRLLVDHREDLVRERTQVQNRLRWLLHELDPELAIRPGALGRQHVLRRVEARLVAESGTLVEIAIELLNRVRHLNIRASQLEREIEQRVAPKAPNLLGFMGSGVLTTAKLLAETAGIQRFGSPSKFARHNATAPIPVWSGNSTHHRLNPGGNRQLNAAIHRIAITHLRGHAESLAYVAKRMQSGDTKKEAIRALKRRISNEVYRRMKLDQAAQGRLAQLAA